MHLPSSHLPRLGEVPGTGLVLRNRNQRVSSLQWSLSWRERERQTSWHKSSQAGCTKVREKERGTHGRSWEGFLFWGCHSPVHIYECCPMQGDTASRNQRNKKDGTAQHQEPCFQGRPLCDAQQVAISLGPKKWSNQAVRHGLATCFVQMLSGLVLG